MDYNPVYFGPFAGGIILVISADLISSCSAIAMLDILKKSHPKKMRIELMEIATITQKAIVGEQTADILSEMKRLGQSMG